IEFKDVNKGKIICVICPHTLPASKGALNQYFKSLFFYTGASRFDMQTNDNLLVCFLDEFQKSAAPTDKNFLDILRAARCCFIAPCQDEQSLVPEIGRETTPVVVGKFRNRIIFNAESSESAENSANILGKRRVWRESHSSGDNGGSTSRHQQDEYVLRPEH